MKIALATIGVAFLSLFLFGLGSLEASAQGDSPKVVVTWQAHTYVPSDYEGKALPIAGAGITASVSVISGNTFVSLVAQTINWYVNNSFVVGGTGKTQITFPSPVAPGSSALVEARIPNYRGGVAGSFFLPAAKPQVIIAAPAHIGVLPEAVTAYPFFFSLPSSSADFVFSWAVNGSASPETGPRLVLNSDDVQNGGAVVNVAATGPSGESASHSATLLFQ